MLNAIATGRRMMFTSGSAQPLRNPERRVWPCNHKGEVTMIVELSKEDLLLAIGALRYLEAVSRAATGVDDHSAQAQRDRRRAMDSEDLAARLAEAAK